ncbi:preprotein translocase subunit YajC [bacterium D16-76]|nr:preprotein translocase subunit YajC [bacterium D16-76]
MNSLIPLTAQQQGGGMNMMVVLLIYAVFIVGMYFIFFRPQNKKKKKEAEMRNNAQVGDEITTIGGICGRIVAIKEDTESIVIETGSDKAKMRIKRWAIGSVDTVHEEEQG